LSMILDSAGQDDDGLAALPQQLSLFEAAYG
jgi:hypothetical protein